MGQINQQDIWDYVGNMASVLYGFRNSPSTDSLVITKREIDRRFEDLMKKYFD